MYAEYYSLARRRVGGVVASAGRKRFSFVEEIRVKNITVNALLRVLVETRIFSITDR
jgi:hypothetical protein